MNSVRGEITLATKCPPEQIQDIEFHESLNIDKRIAILQKLSFETRTTMNEFKIVEHVFTVVEVVYSNCIVIFLYYKVYCFWRWFGPRDILWHLCAEERSIIMVLSRTNG